jgi:hypothetical protein
VPGWGTGRQWENATLRQHGGQLKELALDGFDSEQVWEQLALHHTPLLRHLRRQSYNLATAADKRPHSFFPYVRVAPFFTSARWLAPIAFSPVVRASWC